MRDRLISVFIVAAAVGVIDIAMVLRYVPESPNRTAGRFDITGACGGNGSRRLRP